MTKEVEAQAYQISEDEKSEIRRNESIPAVDDLTSELRGNQMNSEMQEAWISSIVPPSETLPNAPQSRNKIAVEFMLPSGLMGEQSDSDTFWETFEFPKNRWPEDNEFRQFMEELGYYDVDKIPEMLGGSVDIVYDESKNQWTVDMDFIQRKTENKEEDVEPSHKNDAVKGLLIILCIVFAFFVIALLKHIGIIIVIIGLIAGLLIYSES